MEEDKKVIQIQTIVKRNDEKLSKLQADGSKKFLSKRLMKKLDKIKSNSKLTEQEKKVLLDEAIENNEEKSELKRKKLEDVKDSKNFVLGEKEHLMDN